MSDETPSTPDPRHGIAEVPPQDEVRRLEASIAEVAPGRSEELASADAALVDAARDCNRGAEILAHLSLDTLAGVADRCLDRLRETGDSEARQRAWELLDVVRCSPLLVRIDEAGETTDWTRRILDLVEASELTFGRLFAQRCATYGSRPLFRMADGQVVTWEQVAGRVERIARGLLALTSDRPDAPVAILSHNRLEMALVDLACLSYGIVNVMIPATATDEDVAFILGHAGVGTVFVSSRKLLDRVLAAKEGLPGLGSVVTLDAQTASASGAVPLEEVLERASEVPISDLLARRDGVGIDELATIMYTSGTTGTPKGICFSNRNIVSKRFCRALALPRIGDNDRFLCYLPLFHTFGRFLEMTGCVFWGATYCFADNASIETLTRQMRQIRPTVFISIPKKWIELHDLVCAEVDVATAEDQEIADVVDRLTGGELRWGLSAAGYLDPEIFRFFQAQGVELMSGFGMTEATGGITMTPPGGYREDSLGRALPGIEIALADDGELKIRGPYVMTGYLDHGNGESSFDAEGWLPTGDLMEMEDDGSIRIVDRKKEIYKNVKGQTIAPQKVENLFRDFESVGRVFLVGDHREFNTALIYPNPSFDELDLGSLAPDELKEHYRSLVVTANSFLAPYERIVDFAVIDRDFDPAKGEVTAKGSLRRSTIERSFVDVIRLLYRRRTLLVGEAHVTVPNWLFQTLGVTTQGLRVEGDRLVLASPGTALTVGRSGADTVRVGSVEYRCTSRSVDLGTLLSTPKLWLGNDELMRFAPLEPESRQRQRRSALDLQRVGRVHPFQADASDRDQAEALLRKREPELEDLHRAATLLGAADEADSLLAVRVLEHILDLADGPLEEATRQVLRRAAGASSDEVARRAFQLLALAEQPARYRATLAAFLDGREELLDAETVAVLVERDLSSDQLQAFTEEADARCLGGDGGPICSALLTFIGEYGAAHPGHFRSARSFLAMMATVAPSATVREEADRARAMLAAGFRAWLGSPSRIAVDPETGHEYRWEDVVSFSDDVDEAARERLLAALRGTPLVREGVFLFSGGATVRLEDILPGGVWVRLLGADHGKSVFRLAVRTRRQGQFDLAINLNTGLSPEQVKEEIDWLDVCSSVGRRGPLVEEFGGYWPEHDLWSEEFIPGRTLDRELRKVSRRWPDSDILRGAWMSAAWSGLSAYVDFWDRTGRTLVVADPTPGNVIVPVHDYQTGARLVSISSRKRFDSVVSLLHSFREGFSEPVEREHEFLAGAVGWDIVLSAVLEVVGEDEGLNLLGEVLDAPEEVSGRELRTAVEGFTSAVARTGFMPRRLYFAAKRFRRWQRLNPAATNDARARTLRELYDTYGLASLEGEYPQTRARYFRETVFRDAARPLSQGLEEIIARLRRHELRPDELSAAVSDLRARLERASVAANPEPVDRGPAGFVKEAPEAASAGSNDPESFALSAVDDYFLARLSFPYLRPEDEAGYEGGVRAGGMPQSEMVVTVEDREGRPLRIRHALSAREVGRLHRLFLAARLAVQFRPEHRFLVAVNRRGHVVGGLFYEVDEDGRTAHMDKVVVSGRFRGSGVATLLLEELCNRLRTEGLGSLTTGFFRPQFFYGLGFTVERNYAGLVRTLEETEPEGHDPEPEEPV